MSVKSFLKTLGLDALKAAQAGTTIIPMLQPFSGLIPKIGGKVVQVEGQVVTKLDTFQQLVNEIQHVQMLATILTNGAPGTGAQKAAAVGAGLPAILADIELLGGHVLGEKWKNLSDEQKKAFNAQCGKIAGDVADLLNIIEV